MELTELPAAILRQKMKTVTKAELRKLTTLADKMRKTMVDTHGVGLSANQVGKDLALFVIDKQLAEENGIPDAFVNPEITSRSREQDEMEEGCLSIPGYYAQIPRSKKVMFKAMDLQGNKVKLRARGFLARVFQHEVDHLNGLCIKDRVKK